MCQHKYRKLGQLVVSLERDYDGALCNKVCKDIAVLQCDKCGDIVIRPEVWKALFK